MSNSVLETGDVVGYQHPDPVIDQALDWAMLLKAGGPPSSDTQLAFNAWLEKDPGHQKAWEEIAAIWASPEVMMATAGLTVAKEEPSAFVPQKHRKRVFARSGWRHTLSAAATFALVLICGQFFYDDIAVRWQADYISQTGQPQEISLPDGSRMVLNAQSAVALDFEGKGRGVRILKGEAWFDVVHDPSRPFHVAAKYSDIEVKGTAFAVGIEAEGDTVILERGSVVARHRQPDIAVVNLTPGHMVHAFRKTLSDVTAFDKDQALGWKEGRIILSTTPLKSAVEEIGKYHTGRIFMLNPSLGSVAVSGSYRTDNAAAAIDSIVAAAGGNAIHLPGGIIIIR